MSISFILQFGILAHLLVDLMIVNYISSEVYIKASSKGRPFTIREVKASHIGQLVKISGIVIRCSDVNPLIQDAV